MVIVTDELVTIGTFSLLTGLSIPTLRHYDELGLLRPASVDPRTGYRRYGYAQVGIGRRVRLLREAELSTEELATILNGTDADARAWCWTGGAPNSANARGGSRPCWSD